MVEIVAPIVFTRKMVQYMKNKIQKILYIEGSFFGCDKVNSYLRDGWSVVSICSASTHSLPCAFVIIEREEEVE